MQTRTLLLRRYEQTHIIWFIDHKQVDQFLSVTPHFSNIGCECLKIDGIAVPPTLPLSFKLCALCITMSVIANLSSLVGTKSYFPGWSTAWPGPVRDSH